MRTLQKLGGLAALVEAATFVVGFAVLVTLLMPAGWFDPGVGAGQKVAFLADNASSIYLWYLTIYVVFGVFLVVLALALYERLQAGAPAVVKTATAFGLIWAGLVIASGMVANVGSGMVVDLYGSDPAQAATVWLGLNAVVTGLGGGNEIVGGIWVLLLSWAALRSGGLPRPLGYLGVVIGLSGVLQTAVPALAVLGVVFGLGLILWFVWVGGVMLLSSPRNENT